MKPTTARLLSLAALLVSACLPLGAHAPVSEKPHLGLNARETPSHQGFAASNSLNAPGLAESLCETRVRSRCSAKERDTESGLDYFGARYFSASLGRFNSVDPENQGATLTSPQLWNGYSYVGNNPFRYIDPDGKQSVEAVVKEVPIQEVDEVVRPLVESVPKKAPPTPAGPSILGVAGRAAGLLLGVLLSPVPTQGDEAVFIEEQRRRAEEYQAPNNAPVDPNFVGPPAPEAAEHTKNKRKSTKDKHQKARPGQKKPPGFTPDREFVQPKPPKPPPQKKKRGVKDVPGHNPNLPEEPEDNE